MLVCCLSMLDTEPERLCFEQIYDKYHLDIYKRIRNLLRDEEDAKDVMQETWVRVIDHISKFQGKDEDAVRAYLMRIARNQAISHLRTKQKELSMTCELDGAELSDDGDLFSACESGGVAAVLECLGRLSEAQRDVLNLYYLHHHSLKEIAILLDMSESAVMSRWNRGRKKLIELLRRRGYHGS